VTLRLRNTLTRRVEPVEPADGRTVRMYSCGPTVYRYVHLGNLRTFLLADFIRRALLYGGIEVFHVKNITDVGHMRDAQRDAGGDRILLQADIEGRSAPELAAHYEQAFHEDEATVNILPAHVFPRATEHVAGMIALAEALEDAGYAYRAADGTLYYDTARYADYGRLSGNTLANLRAGHRGPIAEGKRDHADFALWKIAEPTRREFTWPSRWGVGFPGWHLECSAMARSYLGDQFDLHTGGVDNVFPHHEDEIAQTAPLTGAPPARVWVHGEHLLADGRKMAKSAGNITRIGELRAAGIDPLALRYLCLTARYSHKLHWSWDSLRAADAALESLRAGLRALEPPTATEQAAAADDVPFSPAADQARRRFADAVDDDLDLPAALAVVRGVLGSDLPAAEQRRIVLDADRVFGLDLAAVWQPAAQATDEAVAELLDRRQAARAAGDYATADQLRDELRDRGVSVQDVPVARQPQNGQARLRD